MEELIRKISTDCSVEEELNLYIKTFNKAPANVQSDIIDLIKKNHPNYSNSIIYEKNIALIRQYPNIRKNFPKFEDIDIYILYSSRDFLLYYIISGNELRLKKYDYKNEEPLSPKELYLFMNELNIYRLFDIYKQTRYPASAGSNFSDEYAPRPLYLYYENDNYFSIFTTLDISLMLNNESTLFFFSKAELTEFFSDFYCAFPSVAANEVKSLLQDLRAKRQIKIEELKHRIKDYYQENSNNILKNIVNGKPKILFVSTLFGFAGRNTMADLAQSFKKCGYDVKIFVNKSRVHLFSSAYIAVDDFKPDIAISVNTFRYHLPELSKEIVYINWLQDPMTFLEFGEKDFVLEHCPIKVSDTSKVNVCPDQIIDGGIRSNPNIYKIQALTQDEIDEYSCDVTIVVGTGNIRTNTCIFCNNFIDDYLKLNAACMDEFDDEPYRRCSSAIFDTFYNLIYNEKYDFFDLNRNREIIVDIFRSNIQSSDYNESLVNYFIERASVLLIPEVYRLAVAAWVKDLSDIKLNIWGACWDEDEKFRPYAKGSAVGGEMLSKIYNASKITIGINYCNSCPGRIFESTLSGCLYIGNTIPENIDISSRLITFFKEGEMTFFKSKNELHEKIKFYLQNEEERKALNERGRQRILKDLTYDSVVENAMSQIKETLRKQL